MLRLAALCRFIGRIFARFFIEQRTCQIRYVALYLFEIMGEGTIQRYLRVAARSSRRRENTGPELVPQGRTFELAFAGTTDYDRVHMKIDGIEIYWVKLPLAFNWRTSYGDQHYT